MMVIEGCGTEFTWMVVCGENCGGMLEESRMGLSIDGGKAPGARARVVESLLVYMLQMEVCGAEVDAPGQCNSCAEHVHLLHSTDPKERINITLLWDFCEKRIARRKKFASWLHEEYKCVTTYGVPDWLSFSDLENECPWFSLNLCCLLWKFFEVPRDNWRVIFSHRNKSEYADIMVVLGAWMSIAMHVYTNLRGLLQKKSNASGRQAQKWRRQRQFLDRSVTSITQASIFKRYILSQNSYELVKDRMPLCAACDGAGIMCCPQCRIPYFCSKECLAAGHTKADCVDMRGQALDYTMRLRLASHSGHQTVSYFASMARRLGAQHPEILAAPAAATAASTEVGNGEAVPESETGEAPADGERVLENQTEMETRCRLVYQELQMLLAEVSRTAPETLGTSPPTPTQMSKIMTVADIIMKHGFGRVIQEVQWSTLDEMETELGEEESARVLVIFRSKCLKSLSKHGMEKAIMDLDKFGMEAAYVEKLLILPYVDECYLEDAGVAATARARVAVIVSKRDEEIQRLCQVLGIVTWIFGFPIAIDVAKNLRMPESHIALFKRGLLTKIHKFICEQGAQSGRDIGRKILLPEEFIVECVRASR